MMLREHLSELYELHMVCKEFEQGIRKRRKNWKLYEPTQFVYSFFTFNAIYSYNWTASFSERKVVPWSGSLSERQKIKNYTAFCCDTLEDEAHALFNRYLRECLLCCSINSVDEARPILESIRAGAGISESKVRKFRKRFIQIANNRLVSLEAFEEALDGLLSFVYLIRNNVFHGSKTVVDIMGPGQRRRLIIYTAILLAANELLFEAAKKGIDWRAPGGVSSPEKPRIGRDGKGPPDGN